MTDETAAPEAPPQDSRRETMAYLIGVAGWIVPGLGHALLKMWGRAAMCFLTVGLLVILGAEMRGNLFNSAANDAFDSLGYLADLDRKSTRLNSSHRCISYAVFCLKKKKKSHEERRGRGSLR